MLVRLLFPREEFVDVEDRLVAAGTGAPAVLLEATATKADNTWLLLTVDLFEL
jgi:hypothetical protein